MTKVSIIVPIYNIESYLEECVDSLRGQTLRDIQIILVDDGSTDACPQIVDRYTRADARVVALHKENGGQSSARNLGLRKATGEYVLYVDGDDYLTPDALEKLYASARIHDADIVQGDLLNDARRMENPAFRALPCENRRVPVPEYLRQAVEHQTYDIVPVLYLVRRSFLERCSMGFMEGYFYEDQLYTLQLLSRRDGTIVKIRCPFYYYRMDRPGSTTNHMTLKKGMDAAYICNTMAAFIAAEIRPEEKRYYDAVLLISLYQYYRVYLRMKPGDRKQVWAAGNLEVLFTSLDTGYYNHLKKELEQFLRSRRLAELKWNIRTAARRLLGR